MISKAEIKAKQMLEEWGFVVKPYAEVSDTDPPNIVYSQFPINGWIIDFVLIGAKIALEIDGKYWHSKFAKKIKDDQKDKFLRGSGWKVARISADAIEKFPENTRKQIYTAIILLMDL